VFDEAAIALFLELEAGPAEARRPFSDGAHRLARMLHLGDEFGGGQTPLDRSVGPAHPPECMAHRYWHRCRAVREALLEAATERREA
jgi:hypothetical protein